MIKMLWWFLVVLVALVVADFVALRLSLLIDDFVLALSVLWLLRWLSMLLIGPVAVYVWHCPKYSAGLALVVYVGFLFLV